MLAFNLISFSIYFLLLPCSFGSTEENFYDLLGVPKNADVREIRKAFKKLAVSHHPDKNKSDPDAHDYFVKLAEAYDVLKDPTKRSKYDMYGSKILPTFDTSSKYHSYTYYRDQFGIYDDDPLIVTLTREDFKSSIGDNIWFVNFYSPSCSHCHLLAPEWRRLSELLQGVVKIGAVNCEDERNLCWELGIQQFPSLLFYDETASIHDGKAYSGIREADNMERFIMAHVYNIIKIPNVKGHVDIDKLPWILFMKNDLVDSVLDEFESQYTRVKLAAMLKGLVHVGYTEDENLINKISVRDYSDVSFWKKNEDGITNIEALPGQTYLELAQQVLALLPNVLKLTEEDFENARTQLKSDATTPWLLCFSLNQDTEKGVLLKRFKGILDGFNIGEIDCGRDSNLCTALHISRYPTWGVLKKGGAFEIHNGQTSVHSIERFARDANEATNIHALSPKDIQRIMAEGSPWIIGWLMFECAPCKLMLPALRKASNYFTPDIVQFGTVDCLLHSRVCSTYNVNNYPTTIMYNASTVSTFTGESNEKSIIEFIQAMKSNYVINLNAENFYTEVSQKPENILYAVEFYAPWCAPCQRLQPEWIKVAQKLSDFKYIKVGAVNCEKQSHLCSQEGIRSYPTIRLYPTGSTGQSTMAIYSDHNRDAGSIKKWILNFLHIPVLDLDGTNFRQNLLSPREDRTWVVMFFAPWCGYCHQFEPEFLIAVERLRDIVVAAKVNCQKDGALCQRESISSYPTVKLYQRIDGVTKVEGRTLNSFTQEALYVEMKTFAHKAYITPVEHDEL